MNKSISSNIASIGSEIYKELFDNLTEGFAYCEIICDKKGTPIDYRFLLINPAFEKIAGMIIKSTLGKTIKEIYPDIEQKWIDFYGKVAQTRKSDEIEDYNHNTDKYYSVKSFSPKKGKFVMLFSDITEKKEAEDNIIKSKETAERYLNIVAEIIVSLDSDGNITLLNDSGYKLLGYKPGSLIGENWFDTCLQKEIRKEVGIVFKSLMNKNIKNIVNYENTVITKNGKEKIIYWHNSILTDDNNNIVGLLSSGEDVTTRKKAEEELAKHRDNLEELIKERTKEVEEKNRELDSQMKVFVGRELKIRDLQKRIGALKGENLE